MKTNQILLGLGLAVLGVWAYNKYSKKNEEKTQPETSDFTGNPSGWVSGTRGCKNGGSCFSGCCKDGVCVDCAGISPLRLPIGAQLNNRVGIA